MSAPTKTSRRTRILCAAAVPAAIAMAIGMAPAASAAGTSEIALVAILDEPRGYCVDMTGSKESAQTSSPLQTHTCYDYQGGIAVDQGVTTAMVAKGSLRFPAFSVCVVGASVRAGSPVTLTPCGASGLKAVKMSKTGLIKPVGSATLCLTAGTSTAEGGGGSPVHLKRSLSWETCAASSSTVQQWKLKS
ncbi:MAG: hypothetical protein ACOYO9_13185 [Candidatus Nanopelagicales bacterium]